ncbi:hypothetical protein AA0472_1958 [Acetobacter estunensis NRIC 0472]|uniref:Phage tail protein n=1 Tax=Acetobacter estunensis TaxID=104097 RepID=A0A967B5C6_9PROT|nr:hypothetical protein [Acetobacter estunensis]NHO52441.1 hypothetical protein [Acetobacter estunensis]GBQ25997.1 hypothetical protein AA0472_1958 [Acetobacter estunensis NRIC 0472]
MTTPYTLGRQGSIILVWNGTRVDLQDVVDFHAQQEIHVQRANPLNKPPIEFNTPAGWRGSFTLDRANAALDTLFNEDELAFWNTNTISSGVLYCYIEENDGSTSKFEYSGVTLAFTNAGKFDANSIVSQSVTFFASQRRAI